MRQRDIILRVNNIPSNTYSWGGGLAIAYGAHFIDIYLRQRISALSFLFLKGGGYMLTEKQEQFVKNIIDGMSQADAYRNAYPNQNMSDKTIHESASRLMNNSKIIARLKELRDQLAKPTIMSAQQRLEYLTRVINGEVGEKMVQMVDGESAEVDVPTSLKNKLNAIDIMNKMTGEYTTKIEGELKMSKLEDLL